MQISDGAAAVLLADAGPARALGLRARARIVAQCLIGSEPYITMCAGGAMATATIIERL